MNPLDGATRPEISVVIPTFNRAELLRKAINSVLAQQGVALEVVVSDNASSDHTPAVMAEYANDPRVLCHRNQRNLGMVGNWRLAIFELARADWFVLMSDDDHFTDPTYLARAAAAIRQHRPKFVYGGGVIDNVVTGEQRTLRLPFDGLVPGTDVLASRGTVQPQDITLCNMVFNRADAKRLGFLDNPSNLSCDSAFYLQLCCEGPVFAVAEPVSVYLVHGNNLFERIQQDHALLAANLDYLAVPYAHALKLGLPDAVVSAFRQNARLDAHVAKTLLRLRLHDEAWYRDCHAHLKGLIPEVLREVESTWGYRLKWLSYRLARGRYRRRYPLA